MSYPVQPFLHDGYFPFCVPQMTTAEIDEHIGVNATVEGYNYGPWSGIIRGLSLPEAWDYFWLKRSFLLRFTRYYEDDSTLEVDVPFVAQRPRGRVCGERSEAGDSSRGMLYFRPDETTPNIAEVLRLNVANQHETPVFYLGYEGRAETESDMYIEALGSSTFVLAPERAFLPAVIYDTTTQKYCVLFGLDFRTPGGSSTYYSTEVMSACEYIPADSSYAPTFLGNGFVTYQDQAGGAEFNEVVMGGDTDFTIT